MVSDLPYQEELKTFADYFTKRRTDGSFSSLLDVRTCAELSLLLKYMEGKLPLWDCKNDFPQYDGQEVVDIFLGCLEQAANEMSRPVDAIKHQAKTVTVGTSRSDAELVGILFDELSTQGGKTKDLSNYNLSRLKRLQPVVDQVLGSTYYKISSSSPSDTIQVIKKLGSSEGKHSRANNAIPLQGTKKMVMRTGDLFVGEGKADQAEIIIVPFILQEQGEKFLLLIHVLFKQTASNLDIIYALGDKYDDIKDTFMEANIAWQDGLLGKMLIKDLFVHSDEFIADSLLDGVRNDRW